jgi:2-(1,2-epoxy-1,2-dihydrophenyl)acetyl-CoA isomerase
MSELPGEEAFAGATIAARIDGEVGWILLGGERPFTLDESVPGDLVAAIDAVESSPARALVLAGTSRVFCAGANLRLAPKLTDAAFAREWLAGHHEAIARLAECPLPTVAAVHGAAAGAGCNLAIACDHVVAAPEARFSQAFIRIGLATDMGSLFLLPRRTGLQAAKDLMLTGREVEGDEALALHLADELCPADSVWDRAAEVASTRAAGPLAAYGAVKRGLAEGAHLPLRPSLDLERDLQLDVMLAPDFSEGSQAFLEKRPPSFGGPAGAG